MGRKNGSMFAANKWYFGKENVKCTALGSEEDMSEYFCDFVHFFLSFYWRVRATVFTKPAITRDLLFDIQTSAGACWKRNAPQNTCASSEFR